MGSGVVSTQSLLWVKPRLEKPLNEVISSNDLGMSESMNVGAL